MMKAGRIRALGAMSGTSLDGVDAAAIETDGERIFGFGESRYRPYSPEEQAVLSAALGRWPEDGGLDAALAVVQGAHEEALAGFEDIALVGFHGQTLAHEPRGAGHASVGRWRRAGGGAGAAGGLGFPQRRHPFWRRGRASGAVLSFRLRQVGSAPMNRWPF